MDRQKFSPEGGFSLLEVLVSIVVVTFFTAATMQMLVISSTFKVRAKEYATAANLIQEDLEAVRTTAGELQFPTVSSAVATPSPAATSQIQLSSLQGISRNPAPSTLDQLQFTSTADVYPYQIRTPTSNNNFTTTTVNYTLDTTNNRITIASPGLKSTVNSGALLINKTLCGAGTAATGLANELDTKIALPNSNPGFPTFSNRGQLPTDYADYKSVSSTAYTLKDNRGNNTQKKLWVMRKESPVDSSPFDVLKVSYLVVKDRNGSPSNTVVDQLSSEVIPNAAYQCLKN